MWQEENNFENFESFKEAGRIYGGVQGKLEEIVERRVGQRDWWGIVKLDERVEEGVGI